MTRFRCSAGPSGFFTRLGRLIKEKAKSDVEKVFSGFSKTRENLAVIDELLLFWNLAETDRVLDELEEALLVSDFGPKITVRIVERLREDIMSGKLKSGSEIKDALKESVLEMLAKKNSKTELQLGFRKPAVIMIVGVNGGGKTTSLGKLAHRLKNEGTKVLMAAGDTFRAAASDQLEIWAERTGCEIVVAEGDKAKAATVLSKAVKRGKEEGYDVVLCDTSGRLHTNYSLMEELIACKKDQPSPVITNQEKQIVAPKPIRTTPNIVTRLEDLSQPWTRSPTKSQMEPMVATWHFTSYDPPHSVSSVVDSSFRDNMRLVPMPDSYDLDRGLLLSVQAIQALLENKGPPVIVGIGGPSGSGKTSLAHKMANIVGCEVVSLESYFKSEQVKDFKHDDFSSLDLPLLSKNISDITNSRRTKLPIFDLETGTRCGFKELEVPEECGVIIFEGVYALHPEIRQSLDLWVAVVGGVHSHLISRVQRDKSRIGCFMSQNEIMMTVFPMFQQHIEPHLVHAHVKIRNDFDPVLSPESSLFVLKSNKQVPYQDILSILDSTKFCSSVQNFIDIYFRLSGLPANGQLSDSDCIRVRICEGRFAVLIREPIREGNFIIQPKVDFDISVSTVAGLLNLGYQAVAYIEASAFIYQDGKILIEVDHLQDVPSPYIQIKGANKEAVTAAGSALKLDGSYTTKSYLQIVLERLPPVQRSSSGIHTQQAARLQELVEFIQSQGSSNSVSESSPRRDGSSIDNVLEDMQSRIKRLERWHTINTVLWTFLMSALVGYSLYQRKRQ